MKRAAPPQADLFGLPDPAPAATLPKGWTFRADFIDAAEEAALIATITALPLAEARCKAYTAGSGQARSGWQ